MDPGDEDDGKRKAFDAWVHAYDKRGRAAWELLCKLTGWSRQTISDWFATTSTEPAPPSSGGAR